MKNHIKDFFQNSRSFIIAVLAILSLRWLLVEPYVIPSGSMIPSLLVHDHILVNKLAYGIRFPFTKSWIYNRGTPKRGDIVVFREINDEYFMVKRVIGEPGDKVEYFEDGHIEINGQEIPRKSLEIGSAGENQAPYYQVDAHDLQSPHEVFKFFEEEANGKKYRAVQILGQHRMTGTFQVPQGHLFMMGDNRDRSHDSRYWKFLPVDNVLGEAMFVWLSCDNTIPFVPFLCNPMELRWDRFFHSVE